MDRAAAGLGGEPIGDANAQRQFRADDGQIDLLAVGQGGDRRGIGRGRPGTTGAIAAIPGFPGAHTLRSHPDPRQPGHQRVLAPAATNNQNSHFFNGLAQVESNVRPRVTGEYFVDVLRV